MSKSTPTLVNLNTAPLEALTQLPGVGPALARRIIAARPFQSVRDLILVSGVGPRLYASLLPHLTTDDTAPAAGDLEAAAQIPAAAPPPEAGPLEPGAGGLPAEPLLDAAGAEDAEEIKADHAALPPAPSEPAAGETPPAIEAPREKRAARPRPPRRRPSPSPSAPAASEPAAAPLPEPADEPVAAEADVAGEPAFARPTPYFGPPGPLAAGRPAAPGAAGERGAADPAARGRNRLLNLPIRTRWRILLSLFYSMIALALVGLVALFYVALRNTPLLSAAVAQPPAPAATQAASLPAPAVTALILSSPTRAASATPPASSPTPRPASPTAPPSETAGSAAVASATTAPTGTAAATATAAPPTATAPPPTATASPSPAPSATRTVPPTATATPAPSSTPTVTATPAPSDTPTRVPSPTAAPTSPAGAGALLFAETFDPPAFYWGVGNTNFSRSAIRDGQLQVQVNRAALVYIFGNMPPAKDLYYQATVRPGACGDGDGYGLQFRAANDLNFYLFGVTCEGRVRVQVLQDGQYTILVDTPQPDPAVRTGAGAVNVLAVRVVGQQFQFYANGRLLTTLTDETVAEGKFGLYARSRQTPAFDVVFDDVFAWAPAQ